jgi:hypothetical protein
MAKCVNISHEIKSCMRSKDKSALLTAKANKVAKFNKITHVQPSIFRRHNFAHTISPLWNQAFRLTKQVRETLLGFICIKLLNRRNRYRGPEARGVANPKGVRGVG